MPDLSEDIFLKEKQVIRMGRPPVRIELLTTLSGVGFDECFKKRTQAEISGQTTTTPAFIILPRRGKHAARFTKEGYQPSEVQIKEGMSLWFLLGNLGFGGIPGWIIDAINGIIGDLSPGNVHVNLVPVK